MEEISVSERSRAYTFSDISGILSFLHTGHVLRHPIGIFIDYGFLTMVAAAVGESAAGECQSGEVYGVHRGYYRWRYLSDWEFAFRVNEMES